MINLVVALTALALTLSDDGRSASKINGTTPAIYEGKKISLISYDDLEQPVASKEAIINNGKFFFETDEYLEGASRLSIRNEYNGNLNETVVFLENGTIYVDFSNNRDSISIVGGTRLNELYQEYNNTLKKQLDHINKILVLINPSLMYLGKDTPEFEAYYELGKYMYYFKRDNSSNPVGRYLLIEGIGKYISEMVFFAECGDSVIDMYSFIDEPTRNHPKIATFFKEQQEREAINAKRVALIETTFVDFEFQTPEGTRAKLSDYIGKHEYVLLDFWASWCAPCINQMPTLKSLYEKYHDKGFEIIGISLDTDKEAWIKMIDRHKLHWPQLSNLMVDNSELKNTYLFEGIPYTVLIDSGGKIKYIMPELLDGILSEVDRQNREF